MGHDAMLDGLYGLASVFQKSRTPLTAVNTPISEILKYFGEEYVPVRYEGLDDAELERQMEIQLAAYGIMFRRAELPPKWWTNTVGPMLGVASGEAIALIPSRSGYTYTDYKTGSTVKVNDKTAPNIEKDVYCFYYPLPLKPLNAWGVVKFGLGALSGWDILSLIIIAALISGLGLLTPFIYKQIFNTIIPSGEKNAVLMVAVLLTGGAAGTALFKIAHSMGISRITHKLYTRMQSAVMMRILKLPSGFFDNYTAGDLSNRVLSMEALCQIVCDIFFDGVLTVLFSVVYMLQMYTYAPESAYIAVLSLCGLFLFTLADIFFRIKLNQKILTLSSSLYGSITELLNGITKIKLTGAEENAFARWANAQTKVARILYAPPVIVRVNKSVTKFISILGMVLIYHFFANSVSVSDFIAFNAAYSMAAHSFIILAASAPSIAYIKPLYGLVRTIFQEPAESGEQMGKIITSLKGDIEVSNLSFRYSEDTPYIVEDISFHVKPGESLAIVGKSGCGKSTLMKLLLGFLKPELGSILYDGQELGELDLPKLRQCIGTCMQNSKLISDDIFSNITMTAHWKNQQDAWEAAELAGIKEEIEAMPMGMNTIITENGCGISGGQRQRILIARALVSKPGCLFLDEATSALDNVTQALVTDAISSLKCTRLIIAHRLSTIKSCDKILVLDKGRIAEAGSYDELMEQQGMFWRLAQKQLTS